MPKIPLADKLLNLLFPQRCVFCDTVTGDESSCCDACNTKYRFVGDDCCMPLGDSLVYSCFRYTGPVKSAIHRLKFYKERQLAAYFSAELSNLLGEQGIPLDFDAVAYLPMPLLREQGRGYNQAELLARGIAERFSLRCDSCGLVRTETFAQHDLHLSMRRKQKNTGFALLPGTQAPKRILLVDDICTSGNSLRSCISLLHSAGAVEIVSVTVCRA